MTSETFRTGQLSPPANRAQAAVVRALATTLRRIENRLRPPERISWNPEMDHPSHDDDASLFRQHVGEARPLRRDHEPRRSRSPAAPPGLAGAGTGGGRRRDGGGAIRARSERRRRTRKPHRVRPPRPSAPGDPPAPPRATTRSRIGSICTDSSHPKPSARCSSSSIARGGRGLRCVCIVHARDGAPRRGGRC